MSNAGIKNLDELSSVFVGEFTRAIRPTNTVLERITNPPSRREDQLQHMENMLFLLKLRQDIPRMLFQPLMFIKQHRGLLAHYKGCRASDVKKALGYIGDIIVCLRLLKEDSLANMYIDFYNTYFQAAKKYVPLSKNTKKEIFEKSDALLESGAPLEYPLLFKDEDFVPYEKEEAIPTIYSVTSKEEMTSDEESERNLGEMPQGKSIKWYKNHGYSQEIKTKLVTPVDDENFSGHYFRVEKYNGNNTLFSLHGEDPKTLVNSRGERLIVNDIGLKFFSSHLPFYWR